MPTRKPGGKYKGKILRHKGPEEAALEAVQKAAEQRQQAVRRAQATKARQTAAVEQRQAARSGNEEVAEQKKRKLLLLMLVGKKDTKKFFHNWIAGVRMVLKERAMVERETSWRHQCGCESLRDLRGQLTSKGQAAQELRSECLQCSACTQLLSTEFEMPFQVMLRNQHRDLLPSGTRAFSSAQGFDARFASSALPRSQSLAGLGAASLRGSLGDMTQQVRLPQSAALSLEDASVLPREPWLSPGKLEPVLRASTGQRYFLDRTTMRMAPAPERLDTTASSWARTSSRARAIFG